MRRYRFRIIESGHEMLQTVLLTIEDKTFLVALDPMQKVHQRKTYEQGDERCVKGVVQVSQGEIDIGHAHPEAAYGTEEAEGGNRPGQILHRRHAGNQP